MSNPSRAKPRDAASLRRQLVDWLRAQIDGAAAGAVFGLSGGIDSAVVCGLCTDAVGAERCVGLLLPIESHPDDVRFGRRVAEHFGVHALELDLSESFRMLHAALDAGTADLRTRAHVVAEHGAGQRDRPALARANLKPRLRMTAAYHVALLMDYVVVGTGNAAERLVGYFTKWGDGAADLFPLADLLKSEVVALGRELRVPADIIERAPSAGLWPGQTDEGELGIRYAQIDRYLLTGSSGDAAADREIRRRADAARHKLEPVPIARPE